MTYKERLMSDLIASLNGDIEDYQDALDIMAKIKETKDEELIKKAEYAFKVI